MARPPIRTDNPDDASDPSVRDVPVSPTETSAVNETAKDSQRTETAAETIYGTAAKPPDDLLDILDPIPDVDPIQNPFGLSPRELLFVEAYVGVAEFRAAKAYELAGYKTTGAASRANASRMLTRERVAAAIQAQLGARVKALRIMDGDEALEGISNMARVDIRELFPEDSKWRKLPRHVTDAIKEITPTKHGFRIVMYDKLHAREMMAKADGRLKETIKHEHLLEDIMALSNKAPDNGEAA